jgi:hypothetical protein
LVSCWPISRRFCRGGRRYRRRRRSWSLGGELPGARSRGLGRMNPKRGTERKGQSRRSDRAGR